MKIASTAYSQTSPTYHINWKSPSVISFSNETTQPILSFERATYAVEDNYLPRYNQRVELTGNEKNFNSELINAVYEPLTETENAIVGNSSQIKDQPEINTTVVTVKKQSHGVVSFIPIRKNATTGKFEKLTSFGLQNTPFLQNTAIVNQTIQSRSTNTYAPNSVLQSGQWYKIAVPTDGIYKITYSFLKNLGIDVSSINPQNIRIFGNGGGILPELNSTPRQDDLTENAIYVYGEGDGVFDKTDYVLFYGKGQVTWNYNNSSCPKFTHTINLYADSTYYFITTDLGAGKRIFTQSSSSGSPTNIVNSFDDYAYHENESVNFIQSGKMWFGEYFENNPYASFSFSFPGIDNSAAVSVKANIASRCFTSVANYSISSQSGSTTISLAAVTSDNSKSDYASIGAGCYSFVPSSSVITVNITKQTASAVAWLDYIEVNARRLLTMSGDQLIFRDAQSVGSGNIAQYNLTSNRPIQIWDITDVANISQQNLNISGSTYQFTLPADQLKQFIAFTGASYLTPTACGMVNNQNLHALSNYDVIIVSYPDFYQQAAQLASFHESRDGLSSVIVTPQQIYNEFSSGAQDISAIRDFVKMFYDRAANANQLPKYLVLFGDGSYDYKNRITPNNNFVPTYQSVNSVSKTASYVSDDFFGLLDDGEGLWTNTVTGTTDMVDIGVGRCPIDTKQDAQTVISKLLSYTQTGIASTLNSSGDESPFGNWRNLVCFIADDGDQDLHVSQANQQATFVDTTYRNYNISKIYLDAYHQETVPGGNRYPDVNDAILKRIEQGTLIINWTGHGSPYQLAHELIFSSPDAEKLTNKNKLFFFVTASCEISEYDNPNFVSLGEVAFLNPNGGAIALLSATREVYANSNFQLNLDFYESAFNPINGKMPKLGDIYQYVKTQPGGNSINSRSFALIGDPMLTLAYPQFRILTDSVNQSVVTSASSDTLKALSFVTISAHLDDGSGTLLNNFNGVAYPTVYDKAINETTLSNKGVSLSPPFSFTLQKNILFNGKVTVSSGKFNFSFVVPKDIAYQYGSGRISYYAENGTIDASGNYEKIIVGGFNKNAPVDNVGPVINLYMNNDKFVFGGLTNENPDLFSLLHDDSGINTVGNTPGHDITAILDANSSSPIVLNDFFRADLNTYKSGTITYPFQSLSDGRHSLKLKAWDVYDNSSEGYTEFIVAKSAQVALSHVLNYPNPFTTKTQFYFEHNQANVLFEVQIQIFTVNGKLIKTISQLVNSDGYRSEPIDWDGKDDFGDKIGRGVYIYSVKIKTSENGTAEKYEKLVILN
jgi:hypothetical protein